MSYLLKVQIQGIRSYDSQQGQVIEFYPLTIILGPNGAGKTSIIEALKYVTTGLMPPNSGSGKTFVLDPSIANTAAVRAQVKLSFMDTQKEKTVITRSMEVRYSAKSKKSSLTFKSLNSVIKKGDKTIDQRCVDVNNEMIDLMGVSKAVLNNVIFCHQEDSNWPLSEGKVLKEKFDDIFGSMGYVKALDKIKKLRAKEMDRNKLLVKDVEKWEHIKKEFDNKNKDLIRYQSELSQLKEDFTESQTKLSAVRAELDLIISKEDSIHALSDRISQTTATIKEKQKALDQLKREIKTLFNGSEAELRAEIENFDDKRRKSEDKKSDLMNKESVLATNASKLNEIQQKLNKELTKLEVDEEHHKKLLIERNQLVSKLAKEINLSIDSKILNKIDLNQSLDSNDISFVLNELNEKFDELNTELTVRKDSELKRIEDLTNQLNEFKSKKGKYEHEVQLWNSQQTDKMNKKKELKTKMSGFDRSEAKYNELKINIKKYKFEIKEMEVKGIDKQKKELKIKGQERNVLKTEIQSLENQWKEVQQQNEDRVKFDLFSKEKKEKNRKREQIHEIHSEVMESVGAIDGQFHSSLMCRIQTIDLQIESKTKELSAKENQLTSESTKVDMNSESVRRRRRELKELEIKLKRFCKLEDYENRVKKVEIEVQELRQQLSEVTNFEPFIRSQIRSIESSNCCPVCERDLNTDWNTKKNTKLSKQSLVQKLENLLIKSSVEDIEEELKSKERESNELNDLRSVVKDITSLNETIPKLEAEIDSSVEQNTKLKTFIQKEKIILNKQKNEINSLRDVMPDAAEADQIWTDIQELNKKIASIDVNIVSEAKSIDDLSDELTQKRKTMEEIESKMSFLENVILTYNENLTKRQNLLNSFEKELNEMTKTEQLMSSNKQKIEELEREITALDQKMLDSTNKSQEFDPKIRQIEEQLEDCKEELQEFENKIQILLNNIRDKRKDLERLNKDIEIHSKSGNLDKLSELSEQLSINKKNISEVENERQTISADINQLSEEISRFEIRKRDLSDNLKVFRLKNEIISEKSVLKEDEEKLGFSNIQDLKNKKRKLEKEYQKLDNKRTQSEAQQIPKIEIMDKLEKTIREEPYKSAHKNFRQWSIEQSISEISAEDLNKYYKALDFAVSDFHRKKIAEINKLVKMYWKQAYRGTDIDCIKIVSDEEEVRSADKRRTFNYRVVMVKSGVEMDMRGRCSAGQKVLASLIIRLALAEIFCTNCSVLALDEPTTNLDKHNIESFATAVTQIVKSRQKWKNSNFQLIIITHDEEFLRCLDSDTGQYYYKVSKNSDGFSTIVRKNISDNNDQNSDNE